MDSGQCLALAATLSVSSLVLFLTLIAFMRLSSSLYGRIVGLVTDILAEQRIAITSDIYAGDLHEERQKSVMSCQN